MYILKHSTADIQGLKQSLVNIMQNQSKSREPSKGFRRFFLCGNRNEIMKSSKAEGKSKRTIVRSNWNRGVKVRIRFVC